jgi:bifunctional non-homologous end joining protein LigD
MSRIDVRLGFIQPQLLTSVGQPPHGDEWLHEVKHDGYRTLLVVEGKQARAYTRTGLDWTSRYPGIVSAAAKLNCRSAILDGEVVVQDERGASDFDALMSAIRWNPHKLIFYAFDLLHLDGKDLRDRPLLERRAKLNKLLGLDEASPLQLSEEFIGDAAAFFRECAAYGLEGIVSKLASSRYRSGRSKTWLKCKCFTESSFVIIGTDRDRKTGAMLALLASADRQGLAYAGVAFIALSGNERDELRIRLENMKSSQCPLARLRMPTAQWVKPKLLARVRHLAAAKHLRHATVRGITS